MLTEHKCQHQFTHFYNKYSAVCQSHMFTVPPESSIRVKTLDDRDELLKNNYSIIKKKKNITFKINPWVLQVLQL